MTKKPLGFTLVEMVVVIALIATLAGIAMFSYSRARLGARDLQRQQTITGIQSALERYYSDNGFYPAGNNFGDMVSALTTGNNPYITAPSDPNCGGNAVIWSLGNLHDTSGNWRPCGTVTVRPAYSYERITGGTTYTLTLIPETGGRNVVFNSPR